MTKEALGERNVASGSKAAREGSRASLARRVLGDGAARPRHPAARHVEFVFRVAMLPFILILTYGYVLPTLGVPGLPVPDVRRHGWHEHAHHRDPPRRALTMDFNNLHEIEDHLRRPSRPVSWPWPRCSWALSSRLSAGSSSCPSHSCSWGADRRDHGTGADSAVLVLVSCSSRLASATLDGGSRPCSLGSQVVFLGNLLLVSLPSLVQVIVLANPLVYVRGHDAADRAHGAGRACSRRRPDGRLWVRPHGKRVAPLGAGRPEVAGSRAWPGPWATRRGDSGRPLARGCPGVRQSPHALTRRRQESPTGSR